ncbi:MAG: ATP-binding cassette domain-containing protein [Bacteroidota bacterium]|nr:ATP-binding cassette domain-containing protein [Bacteroidota bacterium]
MDSANIVDLKEVSVFQKNSLVLSKVSIQFNSGEFVYLIGKTGSGKSSLLKTLYAELPVMDGQAIVAGFNLQNIKGKEIPFLRRKIGIVFQDFQLLTDRSVDDNLLFVMKATGWTEKVHMEARLNEVLKLVGLSTKGHKMPHQLSGGEQQRICIARALINRPKLILADEPTGNLDPDSSAGILELLMEISQTGSAVMMATHNYNLIQHYPGRILKCIDGRVIELKPSETEINPASFTPGFASDDVEDLGPQYHAEDSRPDNDI